MAVGTSQGIVQGGNGNGRVLKEKTFCEILKLSRGQDQWDEWSYDFKVAVGILSPDTRKILEIIEVMEEDLDVGKVRDRDPEQAARMNLVHRSAELFQILVLKTEGEAKLLVKSVKEEDGIRAW